MRTAAVVRHVHFEDLGTLEALLQQRGYTIHYYDAGVQELDQVELNNASLLVVLGAPIGAYEESTYPFLKQELKLIEGRLNDQHPILGICLGAQLMARVLGASVAPMKQKEIGFSQVTLTDAGRASALSRLADDVAVLHWHGDQFDIPNGLETLAHTPLCPNQAFALGSYALGLQFHLEGDVERIEPWLIGHAAELSHAGIDLCKLRAQAKAHGRKLKAAAKAVFGTWLDHIESEPARAAKRNEAGSSKIINSRVIAQSLPEETDAL